MIILYTGNGKGKTTASLGAALRALGRGKKVLMVQFIKGPWKSGEDFSTKHLLNSKAMKGSQIGKGKMVFKKMGLGFVGILGDKLPIEKHKQAAEKALSYIKDNFDKFDMIIMDEVNVAVDLKLITAKAVLDVIKNTPLEKIIILTGRYAPKSFIKKADLVTEMKEVKHPFNKGKLAKINIEF